MSDRGLPLMVHLDDRPVLVVGGGTVAAAKARLLLDAGARVTMVAPTFHPRSAALEAPGGHLVRRSRPYQRGDLDGMWLVVTAIDDAATTAAIAADAAAARVFCNAADRPAHCSATLMATYREGDVTVAVSTNGRSPAAAAWIRDRLAAHLGGRAERVVRAAATARERLRRTRSSEGLPWAQLFDAVDRAGDGSARAALDAFVAAASSEGAAPPPPSTAGAAIGPRGGATAAAAATMEAMASATGPPVERGAARQPQVRLVGAGPGDPELLTVAAVRALAWADVVVHDALVGNDIFELIPPGVELIDVGKRPGQLVPQETICALLVELAHQGRKVVRLKGGDPYVFGRGGEEALALQAAGVAFDVVPGVTSALAAPATAGVPVTQRGMSAAVTVITGHRAADMAPVDWSAVARVGGTLVVLMGVTERGAIAEALMAGGMEPTTPVAAIERATRSDQRTVRTTLAGLGRTPIQPPATIVIGPVADLDLRSEAAATVTAAVVAGSAAPPPGPPR
jgi:uroporphyrin-III C-methyltransferase